MHETGLNTRRPCGNVRFSSFRKGGFMTTHRQVMTNYYPIHANIDDASHWNCRTFLYGHNRVIECLRIQPGERVLEIGCGTGMNFDMIQQCLHPSCRFLQTGRAFEALFRSTGIPARASGTGSGVVTVSNIFAGHDEDHTFCDVGGVICNALQVP
jgi:Protein-L-isoaspartate(D-aspartate) O-methyltransferase (PCMT)